MLRFEIDELYGCVVSFKSPRRLPGVVYLVLHHQAFKS